MGAIRLDHLLDAASGRSLFVGLLGLGALFLVVSLLVLMYTRWGTFNPLRKCLALSLLAHLLVGYSSLLYVVPAIPLSHDPAILVSLAEKPSTQSDMGGPAAASGSPGERPTKAAVDGKPWETFSGPSIASLGKADVPRAPVKALPEPERHAPAGPVNLMGARPLAEAPLVEVAAPIPKPLPQETKPPQPKAEGKAEPIQSPGPQSRQGARAAVAGQPQIARLMPIERAPRSPARKSQGGVPSALLERALSVPRLGDIPASSDPATVPAAVADLPTSKPGAKPAEAATASTGRSREGADADMGVAPPAVAASGAGTSTPGGQSVDLKPPSMVSGSGDGGSDAGAAGSPLPSAANLGPPLLPRNPRGQGDYSVPEVYRLRVASNRSQLSERLGATAGVETAVTVALKWLSDNQERDGRWAPKKHGGGRETTEGGRDREAAGSQADSGVSGLALLAFAGSGNTHRDGLHRNTVLNGVQYLLRIQGEDGNLGGDGQLYEFMYCHGMATLALSELAGMTGDQRLREPLARAVAYTLAAQDPNGGGWRYRAREAGDTSQLGWQLMALKSADLAGISVPETAWRNALRYLDRVSGGNHRGLASYRPDEEFSRSMSAEALACRQFLGLARDSATAREAGDYLLGELPGEGDANLYYWYYGSIAMYQLQGTYWKRWSEALQKTLLATQRASGPLAGSWEPTTRWDGYGGRVYTTALATLCLEAYYRFLPLNSSGEGTESPSRR